MCVDGDILDSRIKRIMKQIYFSYFWYGFKIKVSVTYEHVMKNQEHVKNT